MVYSARLAALELPALLLPTIEPATAEPVETQRDLCFGAGDVQAALQRFARLGQMIDRGRAAAVRDERGFEAPSMFSSSSSAGMPWVPSTLLAVTRNVPVCSGVMHASCARAASAWVRWNRVARRRRTRQRPLSGGEHGEPPRDGATNG